ncbi:MAG TPA: hypothetical protein VGN90_08575 [Pyrinomonadaceae bacterium]|nr:hypothetical protein [Pyrinomonadaceae bacterium]
MLICGSIFSGDADGVGDVAGVCIPGMFMYGSIFSGDAEGVGDVAGIRIPGISAILCSVTGAFLRAFLLATGRFFRVAFRFTVVFGFGVVMPGML